jgi:hypothetical protein
MKTISKIISFVVFAISILLFFVSCQNEKKEDAKPGNLLVTVEHYLNREPSFPIYRSSDNGGREILQ